MATRTRSRTYSLPFGELMTRTFAVYLRNLVPFFLLGAVVFAPWGLLDWLVTHDLPTPNPRRPAGGDLLLLYGGTLALSGLQIVLSLVLTGFLSYGVVQQLRGSPAGIGDCLTMGLRNFGKVVGVSLLAGIRIFIGFALCFVPGIIESCRLFVANPASLMEGKGANASIDRSSRLTTGSRWQIFGLMLFVKLTMFLVTGVVMLAVGFETTLDSTESTWFFWLMYVLNVLVEMAFSTASAVAYFMLRKGRENVDVKELAAVFD